MGAVQGYVAARFVNRITEARRVSLTYYLARYGSAAAVLRLHGELFDGAVGSSLCTLSGASCGVVWCGVVWCGVVWCGVVWCGVVWCGVVWCGVVWCGVVWCGTRLAKVVNGR